MSCRTLRGFYPGKTDIFEILTHAHFEEIVLLLIFGQNINQIWSESHPNHSRYVLKRDQGTSETKKVDFVL